MQVVVNGMKVAFRIPQNTMLRSLVRSAMSLPYVPIKKMSKAMDIISGIVTELPNEEQIKFEKKFVDYVSTQAMDKNI